jgi:small subunit ribosomal protein S16
MIRIRLKRQGKRNDPFYRIVAIEKSKKAGGEPLEVLGHWHPSTNDKKVDKKKIDAWVEKGAEVSSAVKELLESKKK